MCGGALFWSQLGKIVFGASDPDRGYSRLSPIILHPKTTVISGVKEIETKESLLVTFYKGYLNERFLEEFVEEFFSERFPIFEVRDIERKEVNAYDYQAKKQKLTVFYHYHLYADGKFVDKIYKNTNDLTKQELVNEIYNKLNSYLN